MMGQTKYIAGRSSCLEPGSHQTHHTGRVKGACKLIPTWASFQKVQDQPHHLFSIIQLPPLVSHVNPPKDLLTTQGRGGVEEGLQTPQQLQTVRL